MSPEGDAAALRPRDIADLVDVVAGHRRALEPIGGGSKRAVGPPIDADRLELGALAGIRAYEPAELVLTAGAATPLRTIDGALAPQGQRLAFEPPDFGPLLGSAENAGAVSRPTIGGVLATNLAGSRRVVAGAARDHFLGCVAVDGRGERFRAGGKVVKNVTGYDLPKLLAGSWGTLAVLADVTIRVMPAAETERTLLVEAEDTAAAVAAMTAALGSPHDVSAAAFDPSRGVCLRLEGFAASVDARAAALRELVRADAALETAESRALWAAIGGAASLADWPVVWRISVAPSASAHVLAVLEPEARLLDWGGGLIWAGFREVDAVRVRSAVGDGHATLFKAPQAARAATRVFHPVAPPLAAVALRIKQAFDPGGRLNPGKLG